MEVKATAKFIRQSPRKARLVVNLIKGLPVADARTQLKFVAKRAAGTVLKVLNSALANAEHNLKSPAANLFVAKAFVDQGPTLKRMTPKAFGRAATIRKRTSHITVILSEKSAIAKSTDKKIISKSQFPITKKIPNSNIQNSQQEKEKK